MAIQPIDLQVLFSRIGQMGKEQADQRTGQAHVQTSQGAEMVKRAEHDNHAVTRAQGAEGEEAGKIIKDEERDGGSGGNPQKKGGGKKDSGTKDEIEQKFVQEAHLGQNIDITG
ncbi:MAG: hypothetical protein LBC67_01225 [Spirochaetales bacterium]|jgi:hypothetical protein|nr:hypothetical protein [Spirochaetales bacterium]